MAQPTDRTDPDARQEGTHDAPQDPPQDQGPAMDDTQTDATGALADDFDAVDPTGASDGASEGGDS
jgi:hypothetical protein